MSSNTIAPLAADAARAGNLHSGNAGIKPATDPTTMKVVGATSRMQGTPKAIEEQVRTMMDQPFVKSRFERMYQIVYQNERESRAARGEYPIKKANFKSVMKHLEEDRNGACKFFEDDIQTEDWDHRDWLAYTLESIVTVMTRNGKGFFKSHPEIAEDDKYAMVWTLMQYMRYDSSPARVKKREREAENRRQKQNRQAEEDAKEVRPDSSDPDDQETQPVPKRQKQSCTASSSSFSQEAQATDLNEMEGFRNQSSIQDDWPTWVKPASCKALSRCRRRFFVESSSSSEDDEF